MQFEGLAACQAIQSLTKLKYLAEGRTQMEISRAIVRGAQIIVVNLWSHERGEHTVHQVHKVHNGLRAANNLSVEWGLNIIL